MKEISSSQKFRVELCIEGKSHFYDVYQRTNEKPSHHFPGVTGFLSVISKPKLVGWAKREALNHVENALLNRLNGSPECSVLLNEQWIADLMKDATKKPDKIKDEAADLGTQAHAFIDLIVHGKEPESVPEPIQAAVSSFKSWWKQSGIELVLGDTKVASLIHGYGGSLDALGRRQGDFIILDWKTANGIYPEHGLQVAAYAHAFYETFGIYCQEGIIVRFGKKLPIDFEAKKIRDMEGAFQNFLSAKKLKEGLELPMFEKTIQ